MSQTDGRTDGWTDRQTKLLINIVHCMHSWMQMHDKNSNQIWLQRITNLFQDISNCFYDSRWPWTIFWIHQTSSVCKHLPLNVAMMSLQLLIVTFPVEQNLFNFTTWQKQLYTRNIYKHLQHVKIMEFRAFWSRERHIINTLSLSDNIKQ